MSKRSRDSSSSPSGTELLSDMTEVSSQPDDLPKTKFVAYDASATIRNSNVMYCSLPPHTKSLGFTTLEEFETHYTKEHTNRCVECGKNLPSTHFLNLHLDELHNPLREALAAKGEKTYGCFLPDCDKKCSNPQKRRLHLIDKHNFPKVYNFRVINEGIDNANSLLQERRRRRVSINNGESQSHFSRTTSTPKPADQNAQESIKEEVAGQLDGSSSDMSKAKSDTGTQASTEVDDIEQSLAAMHFIPRSVIASRGKGLP